MKRIIVNNLTKEFKIGARQDHTSLSRFLSFVLVREPKRKILALNDVSFSAEAGEIVGIIGRNGSGKTTLLRILAGIYTIYEGEKIAEGKVVPVIGLGYAFNGRLTMSENIFLACSFLGLSQKEIKNKFHSIVEFSGLQNFVDTKLYQFSGGMVVKVVFAIVAHCAPEVLLLDEIFAVGDENFRIKSVNTIKEMAKGGATVIFVSHELWMVEKYCHRVIWLDKGKIIKDGKSKEVISDYIKAST